MPRDHCELLPSSIPFGWLCDTPRRNGSQLEAEVVEEVVAEVEEERVVRRYDMVSKAAEDRTNGEEEGAAPTKRQGLMPLHSMYDMRRSELIATLCSEKIEEREEKIEKQRQALDMMKKAFICVVVGRMYSYRCHRVMDEMTHYHNKDVITKTRRY
jgi:hypothetical protein